MPKKEAAKSKTIERIPSGIPGLDNLMEGGFVKGSTILVSGAAGTGKTIFSTQYLMEGLKNGETCMFITLEEKPQDIIEDVRRFGWDLEKYIADKKLFLQYEDPFQMTDITSPLLDKIREHKIQRVVVDSTAIFEMYYKEPSEIRKQLFKLLSGLKDIGTTSLLTSELPEESATLAKFGVEEFIVDTVIVLHYLEYATGGTPRSLMVRKMRRTNHGTDIYSLDINENGVSIKKS